MFARETEPALVAEGVVRLWTELVNWYLFGHGEPWTQGAGDAVRRARETGPT